MTSLIRMAQQSDCAELAKVHVASWQAGFKGIINQDYLDKLDVDARALGWSKLLSGERDKVYLQFDSESLIGFTSSCHCRDDDAQVTWGEIVTFYFLEQYWGKGFSHKLMSHALEQLELSGNDVTTIWVLKDNFRAQKFYAKHRFVFDGKEKIVDRGPVVLHELRMTRRS